MSASDNNTTARNFANSVINNKRISTKKTTTIPLGNLWEHLGLVRHSYIRLGDNVFFVLDRKTAVDITKMEIVDTHKLGMEYAKVRDSGGVIHKTTNPYTSKDSKILEAISSNSKANEFLKNFEEAREKLGSNNKEIMRWIRTNGIEKGIHPFAVIDIETVVNNKSGKAAKDVFSIGIHDPFMNRTRELINLDAFDYINSSKDINNKVIADQLESLKVGSKNGKSLLDVILDIKKGKVSEKDIDLSSVFHNGKKYTPELEFTSTQKISKQLADYSEYDLLAYNAEFDKQIADWAKLNRNQFKDIRAQYLVDMNRLFFSGRDARRVSASLFASEAAEYAQMLGLQGDKLKRYMDPFSKSAFTKYTKGTSVETAYPVMTGNDFYKEKHWAGTDVVDEWKMYKSMMNKHRVIGVDSLGKKFSLADIMASEVKLADPEYVKALRKMSKSHVKAYTKSFAKKEGLKLSDDILSEISGKIGRKIKDLKSMSVADQLDFYVQTLKDTSINKGVIEGNVIKGLEREAGEEYSKIMPIHQKNINAFKLLGMGMIVTSGVSLLTRMARKMFNEKTTEEYLEEDNRITGLRHDSIMTVLRRLGITDFGSKKRWATSITRKVANALVKSFDGLSNIVGKNSTSNVGKFVKDLLKRTGKNIRVKSDRYIQRISNKSVAKSTGSFFGRIRNYIVEHDKNLKRGVKIGLATGTVTTLLGSYWNNTRKDKKLGSIGQEINKLARHFGGPYESELREESRIRHSDFRSPFRLNTAIGRLLQSGKEKLGVLKRKVSDIVKELVETKLKKSYRFRVLYDKAKTKIADSLGRKKINDSSNSLLRISNSKSIEFTMSRKVSDQALKSHKGINISKYQTPTGMIIDTRATATESLKKRKNKLISMLDMENYSKKVNLDKSIKKVVHRKNIINPTYKAPTGKKVYIPDVPYTNNIKGVSSGNSILSNTEIMADNFSMMRNNISLDSNIRAIYKSQKRKEIPVAMFNSVSGGKHVKHNSVLRLPYL